MNENFKNKNLKAKRKIENMNKGITLIALIITIIVLLILAVVAIRAVQGDGILAHARNARDKWGEATANEEAILGNLTNYITEQSGNNPPDGGSEEDDEKVTYPKVAVEEQAVGNSTINGEAPNENNPIIPDGFIPFNTETSDWGDGSKAPDIQSVKNGLTISDNICNEFVWIPVPILNDFAVYKTDENDKDANGRINYIGVLYDWSDKTGNTKKIWTDEGNREPDMLTDSTYGDEANQSQIIGWTNTLYQENFNAMVESVAKYKGFYIGRYEMGEYNGKVSSTYDVNSYRDDSEENNWFGLYNKAKTYALATDVNLKVTSEMIWGCQYDAMMRWMKQNDIDVTSSTPIDTGRINAAKSNPSIDTTVSPNEERITGGSEEDRLNNVYDLLGNGHEWTQEATSLQSSGTRGGGFSVTSTIKWYGSPASHYRDLSPTVKNGLMSTRLSLYVRV